MKLSYVKSDGERAIVDATITTEHACSSYGQPVILVDDVPVDAIALALHDYKIEDATPDEIEMLAKLPRLLL